MKTVLLLPLFALLTGCATLPGHVASTRSEFDGRQTLSMDRAWVYTGWKASPFMLGVHHTSNMSSNEAVLTAYSGAGQIEGGASLGFSFSGQITNLATFDGYNDAEAGPGPYVWLSRRYTVSLDFLQRLLVETNVTVRLQLHRNYIEGRISSDAPTTFRPALRKFLARLGETNDVAVVTAPARSPKGQ